MTSDMNVLVFNCGSSSLKYKLIAMPAETVLADGEAQRVGPPTAEPARILHRVGETETVRVVDMPDHSAAFQQVKRLLRENSDLAPDAVGHRVVHGGVVFTRPTLINADVISQLEAVRDMAPLHNPPAIALIRACAEQYPDLPQVTVFDTAFHTTIPEYARAYALPRRITEPLGIRKYGFHGISHQFVAEEGARFLGCPPDCLRAVSCHLGSGGASLCAIVNGHSVDNTMGYSPLQGLIMSTRSGDLDPAVALQLLAHADGDGAAVDNMLNKRSGVLGMSGVSADVRDVLDAATKAGQEAPRLGLTTHAYIWRIRKYLGAYLAVVGVADAVIFTDTVGEMSPFVRGAVCEDMEAFGLSIDDRRNRDAADPPADVGTDDSAVRILVIHTNEELAIARRVYDRLPGKAPVSAKGTAA